MATRTISTRLAIQGEAEYKSALTRINSELKLLQSALKRSESDFKGQANTVAALTQKGEALARVQASQRQKVDELARAFEHAKSAVQQYTRIKEELSQNIAENERRLEEYRQSTEDTAEEEARLTAENARLNEQLAQNEGYLEAAQRGANSWETQLNNAQTTLNDLNREIEQNAQCLEEAQNSADGTASSIDEFGNSVQQTETQLIDADIIFSKIKDTLKVVVDALVDCAKASIEFESAMAGVAKTSNMSDTELAAMSDAIKEMATVIPATTTEIAGVAEAAGQLGIAKEDLLQFSEVMINLGVATNLSSEEAASALAKFANVVGMSADKYENLGSTIVALGNNFATTEADIVSMATRLASAGSLVGLTESEIMGVSAALSSLGIEAEAGGSAISTLLKKFEVMVSTGSPKLQGFAEVAGMSADEFAKAWGENAVNALSMFVDGLGEIDQAGGSSVAVLDELGIKEIRLSNAVQALSTSHGILSKAVGMANTAWKENSALAQEAETRYGTTESKLQMLKNAFDNVKISIGDALAPAIRAVADAATAFLKPLADAISKCEGAGPIIAGVVVGLGALAVAFGVATIAVSTLGTTLQAAWAAMMANPIGLVIAAIAAVAAAIGTAVAAAEEGKLKLEDVTQAVSNIDTAFSDAETAFADTAEKYRGSAELARDYVARLTELKDQGLKTAEAQNEYATTVDLLNTLIPDLNLTINEQTGLLDQNTQSILDQIDAWESYGVQQALLQKYQTEMKAYSDVQAELYTNISKQKTAENDLNLVRSRMLTVQERMNELYDEATQKANEYSDVDYSQASRHKIETVPNFV